MELLALEVVLVLELLLMLEFVVLRKKNLSLLSSWEVSMASRQFATIKFLGMTQEVIFN